MLLCLLRGRFRDFLLPLHPNRTRGRNWSQICSGFFFIIDYPFLILCPTFLVFHCEGGVGGISHGGDIFLSSPCTSASLPCESQASHFLRNLVANHKSCLDSVHSPERPHDSLLGDPPPGGWEGALACNTTRYRCLKGTF